MIVSNALTSAERAEFQRCKADIKAGFAQAIVALQTIRDKRLYRAEYASFEDFCQTEFGHTRQHINRLIVAGEVNGDLEPIGSNVIEAHARELAKLPTPESRRAALAIAYTTAPDGKVTASWLKSTVEVLQEAQSTGGLVDVGEGEMAALNAAISQNAHERMLRQKQHIRDSEERKAGISNDPRYQGKATVVSVDTHRGFVTLMAADLAKVLGQGKHINYLIYVKDGQS